MERFNELLNYNKKLLDNAIELDNSKWGEKKKFSDIFMPNIVIKFNENNTYMILYQGDIAITKLICEEAIKKNINIVFSINDEYLATNELIVKIANEVIKENKYKNIIKIYNNIDNNKIFNGSKEFDEIKFIGDRLDYINIKNKIHCPCDFIEINDEN